MFFDVLLSKLFYKEKVHKFQQIYGKMGGVANREQRWSSRSRRGGVSENQIAVATAARLFFLTAVAIAIATRLFKFHEISVSNMSSSFVSSIHSFACTVHLSFRLKKTKVCTREDRFERCCKICTLQLCLQVILETGSYT